MNRMVIILLVAISFTACHSSTKAQKSESGQTLNSSEVNKKKVGEEFTISLESNMTTGYSWALEIEGDTTAVKKLSNEYVSNPSEPGMTGVGGMEHWKFKAVKKGKTSLHFMYRRSWEKGVPPAKEMTYQVEVE